MHISLGAILSDTFKFLIKSYLSLFGRYDCFIEQKICSYLYHFTFAFTEIFNCEIFKFMYS